MMLPQKRRREYCQNEIVNRVLRSKLIVERVDIPEDVWTAVDRVGRMERTMGASSTTLLHLYY